MKPGITFNLTYPQSFGQGSEADAFAQGAEIARQAPVDNTHLPDYLSEWYKGYDSRVEQGLSQAGQSTEQYVGGGPSQRYSGIQSYLATAAENVPTKKVKFVFKKGLQILTVAFLVIAAGLAAGFVYLDRKVNLSETQDSLGRMSGVLAQESAAVLEENLPGEDVSPLERTAEYKPHNEALADQTEGRTFNASGNTNVTSSAFPSAIDSDQDGITDETESKLGTNPFNADTDGDGYSDNTELQSGFSPTVPAPTQNPAAVLGANTASGSGCSAGSATQGNAGCGVSGSASSNLVSGEEPATAGQNLSPSALTTEDYSSLGQLGLSTNDVNAVATGSASDMDKVQMQESILSSGPMQESMDSLFGSIPAVPLPEIADGEIKLSNDNSKEAVAKYVQQLLGTLNQNFEQFQGKNSEQVRNQIMNGDRAETLAAAQAFNTAYEELRSISVPTVAKDVHKSFLIMTMLYNNILNLAYSGSAEEVTVIMGQMKSFDTLQQNMEEGLKALADQYGFEVNL